MVEAVEYPSFLLHIHIVYIESVSAHSYAVDVDRHMGAFLHCNTCLDDLGYGNLEGHGGYEIMMC